MEAAAQNLAGRVDPRPPTELPPLALSRAAGIELSSFVPDHVSARVKEALEREHASDARALIGLLREDAEARMRFRRSVVGSGSGLFREPSQFDLLERELLPTLLADGRLLTVWSAGCGDGSELYSVAILLERLGVLGRSILLGSDPLEESLEAARRGEYGHVSIARGLRERVQWDQRDLVRDGAPRGGWRLILCRGAGRQLVQAARRELHETLARSLAPDGVLMLGRGERLAEPAGHLGLEHVAPHTYRRRR
jgi:chemotaxis protein methyltransferase CheR